ncbi:hypothetical protein N7470_001529 [Penicillium chermesinum]|nr:hypothetical protein N7470_001529 [Penicillium chermesinum]
MELLSPHIAEEDKEVWMELIKRDIPQWDRYELPEQTNKWYEVYCDLREDVQRSLDADAAEMKRAIDGIKSERARLTPKIISGPRMKPNFRQRLNYDRRMGGTSSFSRDSRSDFSKKKSIFAPQRRNNALAVPTKHLSNRASQIKQAPRGLIEEHRRPAEQPAATRRSEQSARLPHPPSLGAKSSSLAEREARLRAIAAGKPPPPQSSPDGRKVPAPATSGDPPIKKIPLKRSAASPPRLTRGLRRKVLRRRHRVRSQHPPVRPHPQSRHVQLSFLGV